jgi:hypothetical protein
MAAVAVSPEQEAAKESLVDPKSKNASKIQTDLSKEAENNQPQSPPGTVEKPSDDSLSISSGSSNSSQSSVQTGQANGAKSPGDASNSIRNDANVSNADVGNLTEEEIDLSVVCAMHTFVATLEGQVAVVRNEPLVLLDDTNSYWWLVKPLRSNSIGYIPAEIVETPNERIARVNRQKNLEQALFRSEDIAGAPSKSSVMRATPQTNSVHFPRKLCAGYFEYPREYSDVSSFGSDEEDYDEEDENGFDEDDEDEDDEEASIDFDLHDVDSDDIPLSARVTDSLIVANPSSFNSTPKFKHFENQKVQPEVKPQIVQAPPRLPSIEALGEPGELIAQFMSIRSALSKPKPMGAIAPPPPSPASPVSFNSVSSASSELSILDLNADLDFREKKPVNANGQSNLHPMSPPPRGLSPEGEKVDPRISMFGKRVDSRVPIVDVFNKNTRTYSIFSFPHFNFFFCVMLH